MRFVDVFQSAQLQTLSEGLVLLFGDVVVGFVHQLQRAVKRPGPIRASVDRRVVVQILSVIDGGLLDFGDRGIDFLYGKRTVVVGFDGVSLGVISFASW